MNRWKASAIHLSICACIASFVLAITLLIWYPQPYFQALGGKKPLSTLIGVDVVLGPLLTLIIYRPLKKGLKFDLTVIALLQLGALIYGASVMFQASPVYVVFAKDRFDLVAANEIFPESLEKVTQEEFKSLPSPGPKIVGSKMPDDPEERERLLFTALGGGFDLPSFPEYYIPYQQQTDLVLKRLKPLSALRKRRPDSASILNQLQDRLDAPPTKLGFLPLRTQKEQDLTAIVDRTNGEIVEVIAVDPWIDES